MIQRNALITTDNTAAELLARVPQTKRLLFEVVDELSKMPALQKSAYDFLYMLGNQDPGYREIAIAENLLTRYPDLMTEV